MNRPFIPSTMPPGQAVPPFPPNPKPRPTPTLNDLAAEVHAVARSKGFWKADRNKYELIALMHAELSEAIEALREGNLEQWDDKGKPEGCVVELADALLRILDFAAAYDLDIERAVRTKMEYNKSRPYRHGGKLA